MPSALHQGLVAADTNDIIKEPCRGPGKFLFVIEGKKPSERFPIDGSTPKDEEKVGGRFVDPPPGELCNLELEEDVKLSTQINESTMIVECTSLDKSSKDDGSAQMQQSRQPKVSDQ